VSYQPLLDPGETIPVAWPREKCLPHHKVEDPSWACKITHCPAGALTKRLTEARSNKVNRRKSTTMWSSRGLKVAIAQLMDPGGISSQSKNLSGSLSCHPVVCACQCVGCHYRPIINCQLDPKGEEAIILYTHMHFITNKFHLYHSDCILQEL